MELSARSAPWTTEEVVRQHEARLGALECWRDEIRGAGKLIAIAAGSSILSAVISIVVLLRS